MCSIVAKPARTAIALIPLTLSPSPSRGKTAIALIGRTGL
jgi:hypothetical protein